MFGNTISKPARNQRLCCPRKKAHHHCPMAMARKHHLTTVKLQKQIRQLEAELRHEKQARQELQNQLQKVQHKLETHNQTGCISWDKVRDKLDAELLTLEKVGGMISTGPIDKADPCHLWTSHSLSCITNCSSTHITAVFHLSQYADPGDISTLKGIHSLAAYSLFDGKEKQ